MVTGGSWGESLLFTALIEYPQGCLLEKDSADDLFAWASSWIYFFSTEEVQFQGVRTTLLE